MHCWDERDDMVGREREERALVVERASGEPIKIQNVNMIANERDVLCSQPIKCLKLS